MMAVASRIALFQVERVLRLVVGQCHLDDRHQVADFACRVPEMPCEPDVQAGVAQGALIARNCGWACSTGTRALPSIVTWRSANSGDAVTGHVVGRHRLVRSGNSASTLVFEFVLRSVWDRWDG